MKQKLKKMGYWASVITLGLVVGISLQMVRANWTAPTTTAPNGNIGAPINTGAGGQVKNGPLGVNGIFSAPTICLGTECRSTWPAGGGSAVQGTHCGQVLVFLSGASQQQGTPPPCKCKVSSQVPCAGVNLVDPNWTASAGAHLLTSNYIGSPTYVCNACPSPTITCPSGFQVTTGYSCIKT